MRIPEYLSPSNIKQFYEDRDAWYIRYMADAKIPRDPQTLPMSIGSAFDAYVKSSLHSAIFGSKTKPEFELKALFESQVEAHNRDWAWDNGAKCFEYYKLSGAYDDLLLELTHAINEPQFEIEIRGKIGHKSVESEGITLLGKPDVYFVNKEGKIVILDWKVNGWCSKSNTSPKRGYLRLRDGSGMDSVGIRHKDCVPTSYQGMTINGIVYLDDIEQDWAAQLATYGWLCGADVGEEFITCIDQIACKPSGEAYPTIRVAEHRTRVRQSFQEATYTKYRVVQGCINSKHIFTDMSLEDSQNRCLVLDAKAQMILDSINNGVNHWDALKLGLQPTF